MAVITFYTRLTPAVTSPLWVVAFEQPIAVKTNQQTEAQKVRGRPVVCVNSVHCRQKHVIWLEKFSRRTSSKIYTLRTVWVPGGAILILPVLMNFRTSKFIREFAVFHATLLSS